MSCLLTFTDGFLHPYNGLAIVNETTVVGAAETVPKEKKEVVEEESTKEFDYFPDERWKETDGLLRTGCSV